MNDRKIDLWRCFCFDWLVVHPQKDSLKNLKIRKMGCSKYWQVFWGRQVCLWSGRHFCSLHVKEARTQAQEGCVCPVQTAVYDVVFCWGVCCKMRCEVCCLVVITYPQTNQEGCPFVYHRNKRNICCMCVMSGEGEIAGLTDTTVPRRLGPKRASKIRRLFNLSKEDDVRQYVVRRPLSEKEGKCVRACLLFPKLFPLFCVTAST